MNIKDIAEYGFLTLDLYNVLNILRYNYKFKFYDMFNENQKYGKVSTLCDYSSHIIKNLVDNFYDTPHWHDVLLDMNKNIHKYAKDERVIMTYYPTTPRPINGKFEYVINTEHYEPDLNLLTIKLPSDIKTTPILTLKNENKNIIAILTCYTDEIKTPITISTVADVKNNL